jgi:hypothetical protein
MLTSHLVSEEHHNYNCVDAPSHPSLGFKRPTVQQQDGRFREEKHRSIDGAGNEQVLQQFQPLD